MKSELRNNLNSQVSICKEAIDDLFSRYQDGKINRDGYTEKLRAWEERMYSANLKLERLEK